MKFELDLSKIDGTYNWRIEPATLWLEENIGPVTGDPNSWKLNNFHSGKWRFLTDPNIKEKVFVEFSESVELEEIGYFLLRWCK